MAPALSSPRVKSASLLPDHSPRQSSLKRLQITNRPKSNSSRSLATQEALISLIDWFHTIKMYNFTNPK